MRILNLINPQEIEDLKNQDFNLIQIMILSQLKIYLEELTENTCKYMEGHPDEVGSAFVVENVEKFSYCPLQMMIYQPKGKKEDSLDKDDIPQFIAKKVKSA